MAQSRKARVFMNGRSQHVTIPVEFRFTTDEVYINRDPRSGVISLSEKPLKRPMAELFSKFDDAGTSDFAVERDLGLPIDRDLF
jgi:virulence-associated protein VagC